MIRCGSYKNAKSIHPSYNRVEFINHVVTRRILLLQIPKNKQLLILIRIIYDGAKLIQLYQ